MDSLSALDPLAWDPEFLKEHPAYAAGEALGYLYRGDKQASTGYPLSGRLYLAKSGWLLLSVPNALVRGVYDAMTAPGAELPTTAAMNVGDKQDLLNAHITVMTGDEVNQVGADKINERGHMFGYTLGGLKEIDPRSGSHISKIWAIQVSAPGLSALRKSYGLSALPNDSDPFHITVAVRKRGILLDNGKAKGYETPTESNDGESFDHPISRGELKAAADTKPADAYIITGNPDVDAEHAEQYAKFYDGVKKHIESLGHTAQLDPGLPHTIPPGGKYWIGHSRGNDRLKHAPKGVQTLSLDEYEPEEAKARQAQAYAQLFKELGVSNIADVPLERRPKPGAEHYTFSEQQRAALTKLLQPTQKAAEEMPWRERVEVYTKHPRTGKIYGGVWSGDRSFAVPGGGIDPGETPEQAAIRELAEETGLHAANPVRLPIDPVDQPWSDKTRAEKAKIGRGNFAGSRTHFVVADYVKKLQQDKLDKWDALHRKFYAPDAALELMQDKQYGSPAVAAGRMAALRHLIANAAVKKTAAEDVLHGGEADNMPDSKFPPKALAHGVKHEHEHTDDGQIAKEIAKDHLQEDPDYYKKVEQIEKAGSGSVYAQQFQNLLNFREPFMYDNARPVYENVVNHLRKANDRANFILRSRQNMHTYRTMLDPAYRYRMALHAVHGTTPQMNPLDKTMQLYGNDIFDTFGNLGWGKKHG